MSTTEPDHALPAFARSLMGGKKNSKLEGRVSDELKEAVRRRWVDLGFTSESEYLEYLTTVDCFGKAHVRMLADRRLRLVGTLSDDPLTDLPNFGRVA